MKFIAFSVSNQKSNTKISQLKLKFCAMKISRDEWCDNLQYRIKVNKNNIINITFYFIFFYFNV